MQVFIGGFDTLNTIPRVIPRGCPLSEHITRHVLEQVGSKHDGSCAGATGSDGRPWEIRSVIHSKFKSFVEEGRRNALQGGKDQFFCSLQDDGIHDSMEGAIEMRLDAFSIVTTTARFEDVYITLWRKVGLETEDSFLQVQRL